MPISGPPGPWEAIKSKDLTGLTSYLFNSGEGLNLAVHRSYLFMIEGARPTGDGQNLIVQVSGAAGATDYDYSGGRNSSLAGSFSALVSTGAASIPVASNGIGSVAANELGASGFVLLLSGGSSLTEPCIYSEFTQRGPSSEVINTWNKGYRKSAAQITSVDFLMTDGLAFEQGILDIYGLRRP